MGRGAAARQRGAHTISMSSPGVKKHVTYRLYVARSMPPTAVKHHNISALNSISFAVTSLGSDATKWCIPSTVNIRGSDFERYPFQISFEEQQAAGQQLGSRVAVQQGSRSAEQQSSRAAEQQGSGAAEQQGSRVDLFQDVKSL